MSLSAKCAAKDCLASLYFGEGEYLHEVRNLHHHADGSPTWRYYWQVGTPGSTYPTHSLGPVMQWFQAVDPKENGLKASSASEPESTPTLNTLTMTRRFFYANLQSGKLIKIRVDMMSNRPHHMTYYSLQGTGGVYEASRLENHARSISGLAHQRTATAASGVPSSDFNEHLPDDWKNPTEEILKAGHGGGDYFVARDFVRACRGESSHPPPTSTTP